MIDNGYGTMVDETCFRCKGTIGTHNGAVNDYTPYPCADCKQTFCGLCNMEEWDGEVPFVCENCQAERKRIERREFTVQEIESAGQLRLVN